MTPTRTTSTRRHLLAALTAFAAVLALCAPALGQDNPDCADLEGCLQGCAGLDDAPCVGTCLDDAEDDTVAAGYEAAIDCVLASGCPLDDGDCAAEACDDALAHLSGLCRSGEESPAEICEATFVCIDRCDDLDCADGCADQSADPDLAALVVAFFQCAVESGCPEGGEACLEEYCLDPLLAVVDACELDERGYDDDDLGNEPVDACAQNPGPDCCFLANDGECDEPDFCDPGTDTTDCANAPATPSSPPMGTGDTTTDPLPPSTASPGGCAATPTAPRAPLAGALLCVALAWGLRRRSR